VLVAPQEATLPNQLLQDFRLVQVDGGVIATIRYFTLRDLQQQDLRSRGSRGATTSPFRCRSRLRMCPSEADGFLICNQLPSENTGRRMARILLIDPCEHPSPSAGRALTFRSPVRAPAFPHHVYSRSRFGGMDGLWVCSRDR
jgi:hypothetical protein